MAFLASHRLLEHISGEYLRVDSEMEGRLIWKQEVGITGGRYF